MVGGDGLWNVHVHVDDVGAAIEAGIAGRAALTGCVSPTSPSSSSGTGRPDATTARGVVVVAAGPGLARLFADAGADGGRAGVRRSPSTGQLLDAIRRTGASEVVVLPNDGAGIASRRRPPQAARDNGSGSP